MASFTYTVKYILLIIILLIMCTMCVPMILKAMTLLDVYPYSYLIDRQQMISIENDNSSSNDGTLTLINKFFPSTLLSHFLLYSSSYSSALYFINSTLLSVTCSFKFVIFSSNFLTNSADSSHYYIHNKHI